MPWAFAAPDKQDAHGAFLAASKTLTGRSSLDSGQAARLYKALVANDPQFPAHAQALLKFIKQRQPDLHHLQDTLDAKHPALAKRAHAIMTAWYLGIVGEGESARCVVYENALNAVTVADVLRPPTYCYGAAGSWAKKPT
jgi:hypothetical protein